MGSFMNTSYVIAYDGLVVVASNDDLLQIVKHADIGN